LTGKRAIGLAAGALFVAHPAHVEAIVWISSRKDLVAATFALLAMLTWLQHRKHGQKGTRWYIASIVFFILAAGGKLSVVVLPVIFLAFDYLIEGRRGVSLFLDKIPFAAAGLLFVLPTMVAQPPTRHPFDVYELAYGFSQNAWLLTGLGDYVIYRVPPGAAEGVGLGHVLFLGGILVVPFILRRDIPELGLTLFCWIVLSLIPSQILSFVHPVSDRYLYFSSVAVAVLLAWGLLTVGRRWRKLGGVSAGVIVVAVALFWSYKTWAYVQEWRDPRSVWYAATTKSDDPNVYQYLGTHYQDTSDFLTQRLRASGPARDNTYRLAQLAWKGDSRLDQLLDEWDSGSYSGPVSLAFRASLREMAWEAFEQALARKRGRVLPNLYYRRAKLQFDLRNMEEARQEFRMAYEESRKHTYEGARQEMAVRCLYALGAIEERLGNYDEALRLFTIAQQEQQKVRKTWVPNIDSQIEKLRKLTGSADSP
jgi:hypothetical protein